MTENLPTIHPLGIKSLRDLAYRLGLPKDDIVAVSKQAGAYYSPFKKNTHTPPFSKRPVKVKERPIDNPLGMLKEIQDRIYKKLLKPTVWPDHIYGGVKGKSVLINAERHIGSPVLVTLDIKSFFPTISSFDVYRIWNQLLGCSRPVAALLTRLTTCNRSLPQGASTSTALANLVLFTIDEPIRKHCERNGICYTCWIDDLAFSGKDCRGVIGVAIEALRRGGFRVSRRKLRIMSSKCRQIFLGLVTNQQVGIPKEYLASTRSGIHKLATGLVGSSHRQKYIRALRGRIAYIRMISPSKAKPLDLSFKVALLDQIL